VLGRGRYLEDNGPDGAVHIRKKTRVVMDSHLLQVQVSPCPVILISIVHGYHIKESALPGNLRRFVDTEDNALDVGDASWGIIAHKGHGSFTVGGIKAALAVLVDQLGECSELND
jgi:hypothetical protein